MIVTTKIDLTAALAMLDERKHKGLIGAVAELEAAVAAGRVKNKLLTDAKFVINRRVEEVVDAFDNANGYCRPDVMVMGAYNVPAALKEMVKNGNEPRAALLRALLPLHELFVAAKPLIVKRGDRPTEKQIAAAMAREGKAMTCQCCAREIFAERGKIAHHGYERPGDGWQTASCMGALYAPFEASRTRLGEMIRGLVNNRNSKIEDRETVEREGRDILVEWIDYAKAYKERETERTYINRLNFAGLAEGKLERRLNERGIRTWDDLKRIEIASISDRIKHLGERIAFETARYDGWKPTHEWKGGKWAVLKEEKKA